MLISISSSFVWEYSHSYFAFYSITISYLPYLIIPKIWNNNNQTKQKKQQTKKNNIKKTTKKKKNNNKKQNKKKKKKKKQQKKNKQTKNTATVLPYEVSEMLWLKQNGQILFDPKLALVYRYSWLLF